MFVCVFFLVGLITLVMRVLVFSWMLWRSFWTRNSKWSPMISHLCVIFFFFFYHFRVWSCNQNLLFNVFFVSGKRVSIKGTSINLSNAWKLSWTIRFVWVIDKKRQSIKFIDYRIFFMSVYLREEIVWLGCNPDWPGMIQIALKF